MFDQLTIKDFQSHSSSTLQFSPKVNIISGESNSGKTAIIRALNLVINNRPSGNSFIRDNCEDSSVVLKKKNCSITRSTKKKGTIKNIYSLDNGEDKIDFTAFGTSVPEEIVDVLNLSDINVQQQHSPYFLVFDSPGQVALYIRSIAELDEIDNLVSGFQSNITSTTKDVKYLKSEKKIVDLQLQDLSKIPLDKFEKILKKTKKLVEEERKSIQIIENLVHILNQYEELLKQSINLPEDLDEQLSTFENLFDSYTRFSAEREQFVNLFISLKDVESICILLPNDIDNKISCINTLVEQYNNIENKIENVFSLDEKLVELCNEEVDINTNILQHETEEKELLSNLTDCPSCGQELSSEAKELLITNW